MDNKDYNRIKVTLVEQKKTARWLSDALGKDPATISKWCTNTTQPSLEMLFKISELLQVPIQELVRKQNFQLDKIRRIHFLPTKQYLVNFWFIISFLICQTINTASPNGV